MVGGWADGPYLSSVPDTKRAILINLLRAKNLIILKQALLHVYTRCTAMIEAAATTAVLAV